MKSRLLALLLTGALLCAGTAAAGAEKRPKLVVILVNHISWDDLAGTKAPHLRRLIEEGALGWLNVKNAAGFLPSSSYLTIGMSVRTKLDDKAGAAFGVDEQVPGLPGVTGGQCFAVFTGAEPPRTGIVVPGFARLRALAQEVDPQAVPGFLGRILQENGRRAALFGNADIPGQLHREAALMLMDTSGRIPLGCVGAELVRADPTAPFGWRTDYEKMFAKIKEIADVADVIAVETGDTSRIEFGAEMFEPAVLASARQKAFRALDPFIGRLLEEVRPDSLLLFGVNPNSQMIAAGNTGLAPILLYGRGRGLLSSASTRRTGYVTNLDLAATICDLAGIGQQRLGKGFAARVEPSRAGIDHLLSEEVFFQGLRKVRYPINDGLTVLFLTGILAGLIGVWQGLPPRWIRRYLLGAAALLLLPLGILAGGVVGYTPVWPALAVALAVAAGGAWLLSLLLPYRRALAVILTSVPVLLLADVFFGGQWMLRSAMGSDLIAGGRFYGMGNDLMGVVIGSLTTGIGLLMEEFQDLRRSARWWGTLLLVLAAAGIGLPIFGANVGGMIAVLMTGIVAVMVLWRVKISWRNLIAVFLGAVAFVVLVAAADAFLNPRPTHAGRSILLLIDQGGAGFVNIVLVKLRILFGTIGGSMWSWLAFAELLAFAVVRLGLPDFLPALKREFPSWYAMMTPLGVGCFFAFAVNDTGIIAASLILAYFWLTACGLYLHRAPAAAAGAERRIGGITA